MKAYLAVTAIIFGLLAAAHVWRVLAESSALIRDPSFVLITVISALMCGWGARLFLAARSPNTP